MAYPAERERVLAMQRPTFTWTELPHHLIQSVCNLCTRRVAVSPRRDLIHVLERVHVCNGAGARVLRCEAGLPHLPHPVHD